MSIQVCPSIDCLPFAVSFSMLELGNKVDRRGCCFSSSSTTICFIGMAGTIQVLTSSTNTTIGTLDDSGCAVDRGRGRARRRQSSMVLVVGEIECDSIALRLLERLANPKTSPSKGVAFAVWNSSRLSIL
jgi:hypothetical protein